MLIPSILFSNIKSMINSFIVFVVFVLTWHADIVGNCMMANLATLSPECGNWKTSDGQRQSEWKG